MPNLVVIYQGSNWKPAQILKPKVDGTGKVDSELRKRPRDGESIVVFYEVS